MRLSGTLRSWMNDRGFGFIAPTNGGVELFVHVSALPRDCSRPAVGEKLTYELGRGKNGKPQAVNVQRASISHTSQRPHTLRPQSRQGRSPIPRLIGLLLLLALCAFGFNEYQSQKRASSYSPQLQQLATEPEHRTMPPTVAQDFKCDGRTYCSQMTSCTEAKFFLKNCPGTQMDGNNDGTPCEQQWCTSWLAK
jgi:cold shock CspA family protein